MKIKIPLQNLIRFYGEFLNGLLYLNVFLQTSPDKFIYM